ncbi:inositol polyphosphate-5-phosphatase A [Bombus vancouverensis nearcticus]|uniref:inositol polyphosphate-5-phosphatase A n=1 Tax=Bombus vancouverensis nearcticus TaxID=2705178 RepID=UPI00402B980D
MAGNGVPVLLVTANVGSIFEEPSMMLKIWTEEFLSTILRLDPKFIALHCQEVGGKNYEHSTRQVEDFVRLLMSSEELRLFDKIRVFLDEDYSSAEHFTALGNLYFVHESLKEVLLWDFQECTFIPVDGKEIHSGNIEAVTTKEKAKFPQEFFPECKWSRKGFLRTRWSISGTVFDLINIHLFHDASNFIAMETFPSVYSKTRRRALEHTLDRFHNDKYSNVPYFLFGDFNFRTDTAGVIKKLTEDTQERRLSNKGSISKLQFHNKDDDLILTLGKKEFSYYEHQNVFVQNSGQWLREYDRELEDFDGRLFEFPIKFVPSYPFEEDINEGSNYMQTRVPAWCDRVLLSPTAKMLVQDISSPDAMEYGIIGPTTCMGDHKPVYLRANLIVDEGMINCCSLSSAPEFCFRVPSNYVELLSMLPDYSSCASGQVNYTDRSTNLLHAAPIKHDPYTPDSMDSPSPNAIISATGELPDVDIDNMNNVSMAQFVQTSNFARRLDTAVSPALLKSKLELIVRNKKQEAMDADQDTADIKRSPSDCCLHSWPNTEECKNVWSVRTNRCNSDLSWQRSHLLTEAWVQSKGQQGYHSFGDFIKRSSLDSTPPNGVEGLPSDLIIPRISIINASNFESNESSVYLHDDKYSDYSDKKLSTYSDDRTKSLSGEAFSSGKSDELCDKTDDESNRLSLNTKKIGMNESVYLQNISELITKPDKNSCAMVVSTNLFNTDGKMSKMNEERMLENREKCLNQIINTLESTEDNNSKNQRALADDALVDKTSIKSRSIISETTLADERTSEVLQVIAETEQRTVRHRSEREDRLQNMEAENIKSKQNKCNETNVCTNVEDFDASSKQTEISRCCSKCEMIISQQITRSDFVQNQSSNDNTEDIKLKLKACNSDIENYKDNIIGKESKCQKCCCVIS